MNRIPALLVGALLVVATAGAAHADVLEAIFPKAKEMAPPKWMIPGTRVTWYVSDSVQYADPRKGSAGHGYCELYVVAVEPERVVLELRRYFLPGERNGPGRLFSVEGLVVETPGVHHRYWIHPDALAAAREDPPPETKITEVEVDQGDEKRKAILVRYTKGNSDFSWSFDAKTGLALNRAEAHIDPIEQRKSGALSELRDVTELDLPWKGQKLPSWLGDVSEIRYRGVLRDQSAPGVSVPLATRFRKLETGDRWARFERSAGEGMTTEAAEAALDEPTARRSSFVSGGASPSALWIDPKFMKKLEAGDRLFGSEVTGIEVTVFYVGPDQGRDVCVLRWANPLCRIDYVYDRTSGGLLRNVWQTETATQDFVLQGTR